MIPVEGSLGFLGPGLERVGLLIGFPGQRTWPHRPRTLVERVATIVPGEPEPWPGFRGIGGSGMPNK